MSQLTDRLERDLREVAAGAQPSPSAWESILARLDDNAESEVELVLAPTPTRSKRPVWLAVAAAALVVIIGSVAVLTTAGDDESISFSASDLTATFVSPRNGFSVTYSDKGEGTVTPATELLGSSERVDDGFDVVETGSAAVFKGASTGLRSEIPDGVSFNEWVDEHISGDGVGEGGGVLVNVLPDGCGVPRSQQAEITIDGRSGRVAECQNHIEATVVVGERLYLFTLSHDRSDARAVFDAFAATIDLTPETAADWPAMTTNTFVSPTYGYSYMYGRGGPMPATERWDPVNHPLDDINFDGRFDGLETGLGNYFEAASSEIPDGVSIDAWVDEHVSPGGCEVPRSQQEDIAIDGQSGRLAECAEQIEATVAAGGRLYIFIGGPGRRNRAFFDEWIATIDLTPETAAVP